MLKYALLFAFCLTLFGATMFAAIAGPRDRSVMPQDSYQVADDGGDNIVCCRHGAQVSFVKRRRCMGWQGGNGVIVPNAQCRHDANTDANTLSPDSGGAGHGRVCCEKAGHIWWSTKNACHLQGGNLVGPNRC